MKRTLVCGVLVVMVCALVPGAWTGEVETGAGCVTFGSW